MKKSVFYALGVAVFTVLTLTFGLSVQDVNAQVSTDVNLVISGGATLTIGATGSFTFDTIAVPTVATNQEKQFTGADYFRVKDLVGDNSGYYTTIQVSDLVGDNTSSIISASNLLIKVPSTGSVLITGTANNLVTVGAGLLNYTNFSSAINFIRRDQGANNGILGKYAYFPWLQLTIPAYQAADTYHGTITYTLYTPGL